MPHVTRDYTLRDVDWQLKVLEDDGLCRGRGWLPKAKNRPPGESLDRYHLRLVGCGHSPEKGDRDIECFVVE